MKRIFSLLLCCLLLAGCGAAPAADSASTIAATTKPIYEFTAAIAAGTGITVERLITEEVSCLHDHTLTVAQMRLLEKCDAVIVNGGGLEDFMADTLPSKETVIDASAGLTDGGDPHLWLDPKLASQMAKNIADGLIARYPEQQSKFRENLGNLQDKFLQLQAYAAVQTEALPQREIVTFHDGFSHFANALSLTVAACMEVEHGSEPSAKDLETIVTLVREKRLPAVFTEVFGSADAANVVAKETGCKVFALDMVMGKDDYFAAMRHNIDTVKEALS